MYSTFRSTVDKLRDKYAPVSYTSTFRNSGQITPEEFVAAGDFLTYRFPSWQWSDASEPSLRATHLPDNKQYLVTRGVPCNRRLDDNFAGDAGQAEDVVHDQLTGADTRLKDDDDGWLRTGGGKKQEADPRDVRTLDGSGNLAEKTDEDEDEIPDMEDDEDDDEAIIRDPSSGAGHKLPIRTYNLYITYTKYYRTPRMYLSGYGAKGEPLPPQLMMEDIVGDYKDKTVTLEDFPFFNQTNQIKMASVHPCKHASVMKTLLDRADAALKSRRHRLAAGGPKKAAAGLEGLIDDTSTLSVADKGHRAGVSAAGGGGGDEWEVLQPEAGNDDDESAIRVDQYLVVFLKFMASVTPGIEHDFTMGI